MKWSINAAALEFGSDRRTLTKGLQLLGVDVKKGAKYATADICRALYGDLDFERTRDTRAAASLRELELAQKRGELVAMSEVAAIVNPILLAARQRLNALPSECGSRCNPTDPVLSEQQLNEWVARSLPLIRECLPKVKK